MKRKRYSKELRAKVAVEAIKRHKTVNELAADPVDSGHIYLQEWIDLNGDELNSEWRALQAAATGRLCTEWVENYPEVLKRARVQKGEPTYYARRRAEHSELNLEKSFSEQFDLLRIVDNERHPAFVRMRGKTLRLTIREDTE